MVFMGKPYSAVVINFGPGEENYYVIDEYLFQELLEYLKTKENITKFVIEEPSLEEIFISKVGASYGK